MVGVLAAELLVYPGKVLPADRVTAIKVPQHLEVVAVVPGNLVILTLRNRLMAEQDWLIQ